jgi:hypothetical protein
LEVLSALEGDKALSALEGERALELELELLSALGARQR